MFFFYEFLLRLLNLLFRRTFFFCRSDCKPALALSLVRLFYNEICLPSMREGEI